MTRRAIQLNPTLSRAQANLAIDQRRVERVGGAGADARGARLTQMEVHAEGQLAQFNLGLAFRQKGYYGEALREYAKALERGEDRRSCSRRWPRCTCCAASQGRPWQLYDELLAHAPTARSCGTSAASRCTRKARFAEAEESYRRAVQAEPGYALAHNNLGVALYHAATSRRRSTSFRDALEAQPTFMKARLNLALLLSKGKRFQLALEAYRTVLRERARRSGGVERHRPRARPSCASTRMRATRSRAPCRRSPTTPRRTTT